MKVKMKKIIAILLVLVMLLGMAACAGPETPVDDLQGEQEKPKHERVHMGKNVESPVKTKYLVQNKLEFTNVETFSDGSIRPEGTPTAWQYQNELSIEEQQQYDFDLIAFNGYYPVVSGLKDKDVEKKINDRIVEVFKENLDFVPPYRGIKAVLGDNPKPYISQYQFPNVGMYQMGTFNNILSIVLNVNNAYKVESGVVNAYDDIIYVSYTETLNFDLNTGEEIPIEAIFCDDVDGLEYLSNYVSKVIAESNYDNEDPYMTYGDLVLTGQFDGIKPDQKYYLTQSGPVLVFDYSTPELCGDFNVQSIVMPYNELMAVTEKFYNPDVDLYESDEPAEKLLMYGEGKHEPLLTEAYQGFQDMIFTRNVSAAPETPEALKEKMLSMADMNYEEEYERITGILNDEIASSGAFDSVYMSSNKSVNSNVVGNYLNLTTEFSSYINANYGSWGDTDYRNFGWNEHVLTGEVYSLNDTSKDPKPLELSDIFVKDADYETIIKQAMIDSLNSALKYRAEDYEKNTGEKYLYFMEGDEEKVALDKQYLEAIYNNTTGFTITASHLVLTRPNYNFEIDIFREIYGYDAFEAPESNDYGRLGHNLTSISLKSLGYENLVIYN